MSSTSLEDTAAAAAQAGAEIAEASRDTDPERADLLAQLATSRHFLRFTARDMTDEQARQRPTVSALSLGGLIRHVTSTETTWARFITEGPSAMPDFAAMTPADFARFSDGFQLPPDQTLRDALDAYAKAAAATDELVRTVPDLNAEHPLPNAPWFPPGGKLSVRGAILHIITETAQHAGHADIIRESLDGAKSMG